MGCGPQGHKELDTTEVTWHACAKGQVNPTYLSLFVKLPKYTVLSLRSPTAKNLVVLPLSLMGLHSRGWETFSVSFVI